MSSLKNYKFDLKSKYERYLKVSFILSLIFVIAAFKFSPKSSRTEKVNHNESDVIIVKDIEPTRQKEPSPDKPKPVTPVISISDEIDDIIFENVSIDNSEEFSKIPDKKKERTIEEEQGDFVSVEQIPEIIGGLKTIQNKLYYPEFPKRAGIEGRVIVEAVIDEDGNVLKVEILKSLFPQLDEIAMNAVKQTKFIPGKQRDKPVKVKVAIPIDFRLK